MKKIELIFPAGAYHAGDRGFVWKEPPAEIGVAGQSLDLIASEAATKLRDWADKIEKGTSLPATPQAPSPDDRPIGEAGPSLGEHRGES